MKAFTKRQKERDDFYHSIIERHNEEGGLQSRCTGFHVIWGNIFNLSWGQFSHMKKENDTYFIGLLWALSVRIHIKLCVKSQ